MSVATLGFAVDSAPLVGASKALNELTAAAKPAAVAAADLSKAASTGTAAFGAHTNATNASASAHKGLSTQAMAAQHSIRSMVEQLAMGIPPTQVLTSQMNHLSYAASGPGGLKGAFTEALGAFRSFLSPTALVAGGLTAIAAASIIAVNNLAKLEKQFDDTSRAAGLTLAQLHGLDSAAAFKGIDTKDFLATIQKFGASVYDAQHSMGGLAETFRANNTSAKTFNDYLEKSADLIKNASTDQQRLQILQQMGLPATMEWVRFMSQGSQGIRDAIAEASKFNDAADQMLIAKARAFDEAWDKAVKNLGTGLRNAVLQGVSWLDQLGDAGTRAIIRINNSAAAALPSIFSPDQTGNNMLRNALKNRSLGYDVGTQLTNSSSVDQFYSGLGKGAPGNAAAGAGSTVDPNALQHSIQLEQQHIALLGQSASASDAVRAVELQVQAARLSGVSITKKQVDVLKKLTYEQSIGITQIKSQIDSYNIEAATIGMSAGAAAQYAAVQNALNDAKRQGKTLTDADVTAITAQAAALGDAASKADLMRTAYSGLVQGPLQTLTSQIANGAKFFDALKSAGISALNAIASKLADMAAQSLWTSAFGGSTGGGLLGLLGLGGSSTTSGLGGLAAIHHTGGIAGDVAPMRYVHPAYFDDAPRYHSGGIAGLAPDEVPAILQRGERIIPRNQVGASTSQGVHVTVGVSVDNDGNLQAYVKDVAQSTTASGVSAALNSPQFVDRVGAASKKAASRRLGR